MITIPDSIKTLLKSDGIKKNFRVHFPGGEHKDITNENIVSDSLSFTESICSQGQLKFGLCETPYIEFETYDVGNIRGSDIECYIEIFCDSSVDGAVYKEDVGSYVYQIAYGTYTVSSCRKQSDMTHRIVKAYSDISTTNKTTNDLYPLSQIINNDFYWDKKAFKLSILALLNLATVSVRDMDDLPDGYHMSSTLSIGDYKFTYYYTEYWTLADCFDDKSKSFALYPYAPADFLKKCDELWDIMADKCPSFDCSEYKKIFIDVLTNKLVFMNNGIDYYYTNSNVSIIAGCNQIFYFPYLYITDTLSTTQSWYTYSTEEIKAIYTRFTLSYNDEIIFDTGEDSGVKIKYYVGDQLLQSGIKYAVSPGTKKKSVKLLSNLDGSVSKTVYKYDWSSIFKLDISNMIEPYYELSGKFGRITRDGEIETFSLKDAYEQAESAEIISKSEYSSLWYDDDESLPFGKIFCKYKNGTGDIETWKYCDGFSDSSDASTYLVYDISSNGIIQSNTFTESEISEILSEIATEIGGIKYMPIELNMIGRPDIECGDFIRIITDDGMVSSFVEQRTLSGIMEIKDDIVSTSDETGNTSSLKAMYDADSETLTLFT